MLFVFFLYNLKMLRIEEQALTFDDVLLVPQYSSVLPQETDLSTKLTKQVNLKIPIVCPGVPDDILSQKKLWGDDHELWNSLQSLSDHFKKNFRKFENEVPDKIKLGGPN